MVAELWAAGGQEGTQKPENSKGRSSRELTAGPQQFDPGQLELTTVQGALRGVCEACSRYSGDTLRGMPRSMVRDVLRDVLREIDGFREFS